VNVHVLGSRIGVVLLPTSGRPARGRGAVAVLGETILGVRLLGVFAAVPVAPLALLPSWAHTDAWALTDAESA
jgi:hypothetical protein